MATQRYGKSRDLQHGAGGRPSEKITIQVDVPGGKPSSSDGPQGASVYLTVDTSGSMAGSKLNQVIESLRDIIAKAPEHTRIHIRKFANDVQTVVTKQKKYMDVDRAMSGMRAGGLTALFDAIGQTIQQVPYKEQNHGKVYILVFTDGEENVSKTQTQESVLAEINKFVAKPRMFFSFIQAGRAGQFTQLVQKIADDHPKSCSVLNVEDSADGIKIAFTKARKHMMTQIQVEIVGTAGLSKSLMGLRINTSDGKSRNEITYKRN